jgi:serine/threonine-protein phosphatase 4 regulatory subunit 1
VPNTYAHVSVPLPQSCRLLTETDEPLDDPNETADAPPTTVTITSEGFDVVRRPTKDEIRDIPTIAGSSFLAEESGPSSGGSLSLSSSSGSTPISETSQTPGSTLASDDTCATTGTENTAVSETGALYPFGLDYDDGGKQPVKMPRPVISVQTFTPLIGSLLMSQSAVVCESAKAAIIGILARLRGKELPAYDPWPERHVEVGEQKTYLAQTGIHVHEITTLTEHEKRVVENELVQAIVIGMARLDETQSPYNLDEDDDMYGGEGLEGYADEGMPEEEHEHYHEAEDDEWREGLPHQSDEEDFTPSPQATLRPARPQVSFHPSDETIPYDPSRPNPYDPSSTPQTPTPSTSVDEASFRAKPHPTFDQLSSPPPEHDLESDEPPLRSPSYVDATVAEHANFNSDEFDSPNAPPVDNRTDPDEAEWAASGPDDGLELGDDTFKDELAFEASHGRLLSMNLISAVTECKVLEGDDVIAKQFVPEVVRMRFDESFGVRREAALAMGELLKVVPQEIVRDELVSLALLFDLPSVNSR